MAGLTRAPSRSGVHILLLGTAAGGGFPQWNCWCRGCRLARLDPAAAIPRTQSSAAVSSDGRRWFLLNASPDVREQLRCLPPHPVPDSCVRRVPIEGVVLTDAELDHTMGILLLREAGRLPVVATRAVTGILESDSRILDTTRAFSDVPVTELSLRQPVPLLYRDESSSGLSIEAFAVPAGRPRFASREEEGHTIGLVIRDERGSTCAFVPGCGGLDAALLERFARVDALLFDGTFWTDDEMIALGVGTKTARETDHLPVGGSGGSLEQLSSLPCRHRVYTHINNTNPMLIESSSERTAVTRTGMIVGFDGLHLTL
jgi:pyrroloquinoline quinone biosynthesis protein B